MNPATVRLSALAVFLAPILFGCGGSDRPDLVDVSGVVTLNGQAVQGAEVVFQNEQSPRAATGVTDADGRFVLTTFEDNDGAVPGEHVVTIGKVKTDAAISGALADDPSAAYGQGMEAAASGNMDAIQENELPAKYADPKTSELSETVTKEGPNEFEFNLE